MMPTVARQRRLRVGRTLGAAANVVFLGLGVVYLWCPVHRFPAARAFQGRLWYNPYAAITPRTEWRKVNLHAHSRAWRGLTNGRGSADEVLDRYRAMGYDAAPVSNYQMISRASDAKPGSLTLYEHGFNVKKVHFLALAPRAVDWLDYPLLQSRDEEQHRIDRLRASAGLVIMAHPRLRHAFADADLRSLTGYTAIEIASSASRGDEAWNVVLDAGRPVWAVADDDNHDAAEPNDAGRYWSMIATPSIDANAIAAALSVGRAYAVLGHRGHADIALRAMTVVGDTLTVEVGGAPARLQLIGPGGHLLAEEWGAQRARWVLPCDAGWVRVVARSATTQLFLEPALRTDRGGLPHLSATVARAPTLMRRGLAVILVFAMLAPVLGRVARRRPTARAVQHRLALREAA